MKYLFLPLFLVTSCINKANSGLVENKKTNSVVEQSDYKRLASSKDTYTLYYKTKETISTPVILFTYYITKTDTNKMVRTAETVAAEKIYWKDDHTLAVIPYTDAMQQNDEVGVPNKRKEILIDIK